MLNPRCNSTPRTVRPAATESPGTVRPNSTIAEAPAYALFTSAFVESVAVV